LSGYHVLVDAPPLAGLSADASPFKSQFARAGNQEILTFPDLRGDASRAIRCRAPESQVDTLWRAVGNAMKNRISEFPVWQSTAGLGVFWLHVGLDSKPKYYRHGRYAVHP